MTQTLEEIITAGMGALELARRAEADKAADKLAYQLEFERQKLESAKLLIPKALRELAHISGDGLGEALVVTLPDGAKVEHIITVVTKGDWARPTLSDVELAENRKAGNKWTAYEWFTNDGAVAYYPAVDCESLETALAMAVELYDGRQEVENDAKRWKDRMKYREEEAALKPPAMFCPLIDDICKRDKCAFWVEASGACAVWALGENAWDVCHKRALKG